MKLSINSKLPIAATVVALALATSAGIASAAVQSLSTGVGEEARTAHPSYSVLLSFAEAKGPYLADIGVNIQNTQGKTVLERTSQGPWLFVDLPPGEYHVVAKDKTGEATGANFQAPAKGQDWVHLTW